MFTYRGKTALITGASSGIGEAFARQLAPLGMSLIVVARSTDRLQRLAADLTSRYPIQVEIITTDLADPSFVVELAAEVERRGLTVDLLINNAGFGLHGPFETLSAEQEQQEIQLNIGTLVAMTHAFLPKMLARSSGGVINVASTLALQPAPYMAVYGATKAFVLSFTQALAEEYRGRGVQFLALCPGPTATNFFAVSGGREVFARMSVRKPEQVAATGLRALNSGRMTTIDGASNRWLFGLLGALPTSVSARMVGNTMRPKAG
jgi:uncharacterized protein